ncbi:MAG TPA: pitrilysin family protein [Candidatus Angelobacter sp.]|nr:pitrilysin family protein [Candidatus Angelobacter sp.]
MLKKCLSVVLIAGLSAAMAVAQQPATGDAKQLPSKVQRLNRVPVNNEILKVKLPHPTEVSLPNGLTILVLEQHKLPTIYCGLWIKSGALSDPAEMPGLASFTATLLRDGTARRNSTQIATELDELGATFNADAVFGANLTVIASSGLSESTDKLMDLMSDIVLNPSYPADEWERFSRQERARLVQMRANPGFLARERFARAVYKDFPAAIESTTTDALQKITPEVLKDFHQKHYTPNNAILAMAGDITVAQAKELATKYFGNWKAQPVPAVKIGKVPAPGPARIYLVDRPNSVQSNILAGGLSLNRSDPDYVPLAVANRILGGGGASRLFANLREDKGYTYGAYSRVTGDLYPGTFVANTEVRNAVTEGSLHEIMYEFKRLRDQKVPQGELEEAKRSIISSFALSLANPAGIVNSWMSVKYYGLAPDYWDHYSDQIAKVDADTVQRMAKKYIDLDHLQIVVVGDAKQVGQAVAKYGTVEMFDADGKAVPAKTTAAPGGK